MKRIHSRLHRAITAAGSFLVLGLGPSGPALADKDVARAKLLLAFITATLEVPGGEIRYFDEDFAYLGRGKERRYSGTYYGSENYVEIAVGDSTRGQDIDIYIFSPTGDNYCRDNDNDNAAVCAHSPSRTGKLSVVVKNSGSGGNYGYGIIKAPR